MKALPIWTGGVEAALAAVDDAVSSGQRRTGYFVEAKVLAVASRSVTYWRSLAQADWLFPDGVGAVWLARRWGAPVAERVTGPAFLPRTVRHGVIRGWRHYLLGGGDGVGRALEARLAEMAPGSNVVGRSSPSVEGDGDSEAHHICAAINAAQPDVVWVALGAPKQERWVARHREAIAASVVLAVGAAFDFHIGTQSWAPPMIRKVGMEWAWRLATGPPRMWQRTIVSLASTAQLIARARPVRERPDGLRDTQLSGFPRAEGVSRS